MELKEWLQIVGIVLGLLYLWLEYRADIRLWIVGLVMPVVHGALYYKAGLYADCSMQVYYVLAGIYGWMVWYRARRKSARAGTGRTSAPGTGPDAETAGHPAAEPAGEPEAKAAAIAFTPAGTVPGLVAVYLAAHASIYLLLTHFTNSTVPFWDSLTTALSIVAMWMLSRKYVEQWLVWLVVDMITVGLYFYKGIPLTAGLYLLYSALAVAGYLRWRRQAAR